MKASINKNKKVLVGISGGVDSATTAFLLKKQGYEVYGCFIKTWQPDFITCTWRDERRDAYRVCAHLNIPFLELDMESEYRDDVGMYMVNEYKKGRTPNPDVMCNKHVKFKGLVSLADTLDCYYVATGHYAQIKNENEVYTLQRGVDPLKDQSYFLYQINKDILPRVLFPLGGLLKEETRKIAQKAELPIAAKKDSQGVCFLGSIDMKEFLSHFITTEKGLIKNEAGEIIGEHDGSIFYTKGERKGLHIANNSDLTQVYYVKEKMHDENVLIVTHEKPDERTSESQICNLEDCNLLMDVIPGKVFADIRYHANPIVGELSKTETGLRIIFNKHDYTISSGQSIVLYTEEGVCIGGGVIA